MLFSANIILKIPNTLAKGLLLEVERTSKYRTSNTSNIDTPNFEHFEHDAQILRPNFEQARPNIELWWGLMQPIFFIFFTAFSEKFVKMMIFSSLIKN